MGNLLFPCKPDPPETEKTESVINLSDSCLERLTREEGEAEKKSPAEELNIPVDVTEKDWMMKLKCLDDAHSNTYGITIQNFQNLADEVESQIEPVRPLICSGDAIIYCLQKNGNCAIKCKKIMDRYVDCIDTFRINIIKEQIECEMKEKRKEDQDIVEQFLKNEEV